MFRRYPYWGWLLLSLLLWCICGYDFYMHRQAMLPAQMAQTVTNNLNLRDEIFQNFTKEHDLIGKSFADSLTERELERIKDFPFYVYGYDNDSLEFWNTNSVIAVWNDSSLDKHLLVRNEKGVFVQKSIRLPYLDSSKHLVVLFPVVITYPIENDYLSSHFVSSHYIPVKTKILKPDDNIAGAYPVTIGENKTVFYLHFNPKELPQWSPNIYFILLLIATIVATILWLQLMIIYLSRNKSPVVGFLATFFAIGIIRYSLYKFGLPFNLGSLTFFSPGLYASISSKALASLGDLLINILCVLWLAIFITRHTPYKTYFVKLKAAWLRYLLALILMVALFSYIYLFVYIIRSLVHDSRISFDVSHFYSINPYTILGLLVIACITGISCLIIYLFNVQLQALIQNKIVKYIMVAFTGAILIYLLGIQLNKGIHHDAFDSRLYWALLGWLLIFIPLLDIPKFTLVSDLFEPHMIFWAVFICMFCTGLLQYFNELKELETRIVFVKQNSQLSPKRDDYLEYDLDKKLKIIAQDKMLKSFLNKPSANARKALNQHFDVQYLSGPAFSKYQSNIFLFDENDKNLFNKDTVDFSTLESEKTESASTSSPYIFYKEDFHDNHFYLSEIPIYSDGINNIIGHVVIDLDLKKQATETEVYPELLQASNSNPATLDNEYAYAIYVNKKLISQNNEYPFKTYLNDDTLKEQEHEFYRNSNNILELYYKIADKQTIVVVHLHSQIMELITLFSYLFGIQILLALIILAYQLYVSYFTRESSSSKFPRLTLRKRVHFSMLGVVLISFIIIGGVTIFFFTDQYRTSGNNKSQSALLAAKQSVQDYIKKEGAYNSSAAFDTVCKSSRVRSFIVTIANAQKIDINIYNSSGVLLNSSEDEIYNKGLISHMMKPDAYFQLNNFRKSIVIQDEKVAELKYLSAYAPIRNEHGLTLGYINVPFFSSEKDLHFQISNIVVSLINLYAFIFLFSSLITVVITRWITGTFNMIIQQFGMLNLQRNERIVWPYDDEIGLLVREYNKMVNKVEENAALLAQSERESAWREMARQVAHEIKNPLTPMKLNIQYLQQAVKNDTPNIKELTNKVSESIIEQIDNLSYIASEFSNFAKMPEARPEDIELGELLNSAVALYRNDGHVKVTISEIPGRLLIHSDRSQLLRVFTNLLENAKQAIPPDRAGVVAVSVKIENDHAVVAIKDNGAGISMDVMKKIFQPYFTTKSSGTGLGLAMTRKIIEFWKGEIWFETEEGEGTTFYIKLPLISTTV
jgi:two-component system, NtrC family, nitrogen regulation sensor histidine kinase NtrY